MLGARRGLQRVLRASVEGECPVVVACCAGEQSGGTYLLLAFV